MIRGTDVQDARNITREEDETLILDSVRQFLKRDVAPYAHDLEARDEYPQTIAAKLAQEGAAAPGA